MSKAFLDDMSVDGLRTQYNIVLAAPGVRSYALEYINHLDCVLSDIEQ